LHRLLDRLNYSNVVSTLCLVLLPGGGTAYAEAHLAKGSVGTRQLKKEAVTPAKLSSSAKRTLTGPKGPNGATGPRGPEGEKGEKGDRGGARRKGDPGDPGKSATVLWAVVNKLREPIRARNVTKVEGLGSGHIIVVFDQDVRFCDYEATLGSTGTEEPERGSIAVASTINDPDGVSVFTWNKDNVLVEQPFHLAVFC
jgi:hypothetical protein